MNPNPHKPPDDPLKLSWPDVIDWWHGCSPEYQKEFPYKHPAPPGHIFPTYNEQVLKHYNLLYYPQWCDIHGNFQYHLYKEGTSSKPIITRFINRS